MLIHRPELMRSAISSSWRPSSALSGGQRSLHGAAGKTGRTCSKIRTMQFEAATTAKEAALAAASHAKKATSIAFASLIIAAGAMVAAMASAFVAFLALRN
jgi:hypothetical protein